MKFDPPYSGRVLFCEGELLSPCCRTDRLWRERMAPGDGDDGVVDVTSNFVYRISTSAEWEELQMKGFTFGGDLDHNSGFIHLSALSQVAATLQNFFQGRHDLYLLQIDSAKLGEGLIYEAVDDVNKFPHFHGPSRSFSPLSKDFVTKAAKIESEGGLYTCSLLN